MKTNAKRVNDFRASSCTVGADVLPLIAELANEGWGIVLKKMPPDVGYRTEQTGVVQWPGHWYCEADYVRRDKTVASPQPACASDPVLLVNEMAKRCRQNA